ncbi:MAG: hypothetical protein V1779_01055 [bacterium]
MHDLIEKFEKSISKFEAQRCFDLSYEKIKELSALSIIEWFPYFGETFYFIPDNFDTKGAGK